MSDLSSMIFEIADTFSMEIQRHVQETCGALRGKTKMVLPVVQDLDWVIEPKIVDSAVYQSADKAMALLHVCGSLYLLLIIDGVKYDADYSTLWVIDGAKLDWSARTPLLLFTTTWNRVDLYNAIQRGVVAGFRRGRKVTNWEPIAAPQQHISDYLKRKEREQKSGPTAAQLLVQRLKDAPSLSERYRTKGPRDK